MDLGVPAPVGPQPSHTGLTLLPGTSPTFTSLAPAPAPVMVMLSAQLLPQGLCTCYTVCLNNSS